MDCFLISFLFVLAPVLTKSCNKHITSLCIIFGTKLEYINLFICFLLTIVTWDKFGKLLHVQFFTQNVNTNWIFFRLLAIFLPCIVTYCISIAFNMCLHLFRHLQTFHYTKILKLLPYASVALWQKILHVSELNWLQLNFTINYTYKKIIHGDVFC
jgi:hypothetical protein